VGGGEAAIVEPGRPVLALGTPASGRGPSAYPASVPAVAFGSSSATGSTCTTTHVVLASVSLFGGFVTASTVEATHGTGTVSGLEIGGSPTGLGSGDTMLLGQWGQLTLGKTVGRITAPLVVTLLTGHWSLPAGTTIAVGFTASAEEVSKPKPVHHASSAPATKTSKSTTTKTTTARPARSAKKHRHRKPVAQPLTRTPSLGFRPSHYVFPVETGASYVDTYGANRNDIYDGWHHGDDLFAPLGTPVVAVANGKLSLVGWNKLGGWRLWLTDANGNSFYYAHLAGYSRWVLTHPKVRAGEVVGFLGRTGDAFTTTPHLHFEIHPYQYLSLGYDGAVDPTEYLKKWRIERAPVGGMPRPAKLKAPVGTPAQEAAVVWQELLAARHLLHGKQKPDMSDASPRRPLSSGNLAGAGIPSLGSSSVERTAAHVQPQQNMAVWLGGGAGGAVLLLGLSAGGFVFRRRRRAGTEIPGERPAAQPR